MEEQLIRLLYNGVCLVLSLIMIRMTDDKLYEAIGVCFAATFIMLLAGNVGVATIILTLCHCLFIIKIVNATELEHKIPLVVLPSATIIELYSAALQLPYFTEVQIISLLALCFTVAYYIYIKFVQNVSQKHQEAFETNGLFAAILLSRLIR